MLCVKLRQDRSCHINEGPQRSRELTVCSAVQQQHQAGPMMNGMYGMQNGMMQRSSMEEPPAKRLKPGQAQAVMQGNHGTSLIEAMNALEIQSHLDTLKVPDSFSL